MNITLEMKRKLTPEEYKQAKKINEENLVERGGQLRYPLDYIPYELAVLAKEKDKVIGYTFLLLERNYDQGGAVGLYVNQVAVAKKYAHQGVGSAMYQYTYDHMKGFHELVANAHATNKVSQAFHLKFGFQSRGTDALGYLYVKPVTKEVTKSIAEATKETVELGMKVRR